MTGLGGKTWRWSGLVRWRVSLNDRDMFYKSQTMQFAKVAVP